MDNQETVVINECHQKEDTCCICMEPVITTETGHLTSKCCKHLIHINCFVSYTIQNSHTANKCPLCRYDMNTGLQFNVNQYDNENSTYYDSGDEYNEYEDEYYNDSADEYDPYDNIPLVTYEESNRLAPLRRTRTEAEIKAYCAAPYVSEITTLPVTLTNLSNSSQTGAVYYTSEKYDCMATYNPHIKAMDVRYQTKLPLAPIVRQRNIVCGCVPRNVSIQLTHTEMLYMLIVYPDDGECDKMLIYFPHSDTVIMSAFVDKESVIEHNLDNLQITGFSDTKHNNRFIYVNDCEFQCGSLLAEVIEFQKLKQIFNS